jgi:toxin CcdB
MNSFKIYRNLAESKTNYPYLLDVQNTIFSEFSTRLVIPLSLQSKFGKKQIKTLNPIITMDNIDYIVLTQQITAIDSKFLGKEIMDIEESRTEVLAAIDFLITGF